MAPSLRSAISDTTARAKAWPRPDASPRATLAALKRLELRDCSLVSDMERDVDFLARVSSSPPSMLSTAELRKTLPPAWRTIDRSNPVARDWLSDVTARALSIERRPTDRAIVTTWLDVFPEGPGADQLAAAAAIAAERHDWPYKSAGRQFRLWNRADAIGSLAASLLTSSPDDVLRAAALTPGLYDARLVQLSLSRAADQVAAAGADRAHHDCDQLLSLVEGIGAARAPLPNVVRALLLPWRNRPPQENLRIRIQRFLIREVSDPRSQPARWQQMQQALVALGHGGQAAELTLVLRRWLVRASFELFFKLMRDSTSDREQWRRREKFWRYYLERDFVTDSWFVLGGFAEHQAAGQRQALVDAGGFGRISDGANFTQSALIMRIGELTVAEWSDNGSCCFWQPGAVHTPPLYAPRYDGRYLRATEMMKSAALTQSNGGRVPPRWEAKTHRGDWEPRFADHIRDLTGIRNSSVNRW